MSPTVSTVDTKGQVKDVAVTDLAWRPSVYGIVIRDDKILLCPQFGDKYDLPGGAVERGESLEGAVLREVKEETGLDVAVGEVLDAQSTFFTFNHEGGESYQTIMLFYACEFLGGELSTDGFDEYEKEYTRMAEWVPLTELKNIQVASSFNWRKTVQKLL
jgi:8-oxo-dGTP diphosphatase